jgi:hypothetical protein
MIGLSMVLSAAELCWDGPCALLQVAELHLEVMAARAIFEP